MNPLRISAISYLNTLPFTYGLQSCNVNGIFHISQDVPSTCAEKLINNEADIGIVPVAMIPLIPNAQIITKYCIGAEGPVKTVIIVANQPIEETELIYLDPDSRTSVKLARILAEHHWKKKFKWEKLTSEAFTNLPKGCGAVLIGDKTFGLEKTYSFVYDLAEEWIKLTSLPFVFACWVANKLINPDQLAKFESAIDFGIAHRREAIACVSVDKYIGIDIETYLMKTISYNLTARKMEGLNKFLEFIR